MLSRRSRSASSSRSLNLRAGQALELASQVVAQVAYLVVAHLGIGFGGLYERGREGGVRRSKVLVGAVGIAGAPQLERLVLEVLGQVLDAAAFGLGKHQPAAVQGP